MKNLFRALLVLAILILAGIAALSFWIGPKVEEATRRELANLPTLFTIAGQLQFSPSEVREIEFSPLSRRMILRGLTFRGTVNPQTTAGPDAPRHFAPAEMRYTLEEASYRLPLRVLLLFTPLRDIVLPKKGMMTVGDNLRISNLAYSLVMGPLKVHSAIKSEEANDIRIDSALFRELLTAWERGEDLPQEGASRDLQDERSYPDLLRLTYRMGIRELRVTGMSMRTEIPELGVNDYSCDAMSMRNWEGRNVQEAAFEGLRMKDKGREVFYLGNITEKGIVLPEEAALRELLALAYQPRPNPKALFALLQQMLTSGEPLFKEFSASDLRIPFRNGADRGLSIKKAALNWQSNTPLQYSFNMEALSLTTDFLERESGLTFPGLPALVLDATQGFAAQGTNAMREHGTIRAEGLGALEYDALVARGGGALTSAQSLLTKTLDNVRLKYTDQGLTAYLARNILPAKMATPLLKAGIEQICSGPAPENTAIREALDIFAMLPGVLEVQSRPGKTFTLLELEKQLFAKNPGALLSVTVQPGKESLEAQINSLNAAAAK